jgi:Nucleotide modification associated domain 3
MKVIISRKGFDSRYGGCASPIFPDGSMLSLPIPTSRSQVRYQQLDVRGRNVGQVVEELTGGKLGKGSTTHLDPDLDSHALPRRPGWRPAFGQTGGQLTHLKNQGVTAGDLFLFFGWFREVGFLPDGRLMKTRLAPNRQVIYGWLQVDHELQVGSDGNAAVQRFPWLCDHPHVSGTWSDKNSIFVAKQQLDIPGCPELRALPGGSSFGRFVASRCLTKEGQDKRSLWSLPAGFSPTAGLATLSLHENPSRWTPDREDNARVLLDSAKIGQEFVLSSRDPKLTHDWLRSIFADTLNLRTKSLEPP